MLSGDLSLLFHFLDRVTVWLCASFSMAFEKSKHQHQQKGVLQD